MKVGDLVKLRDPHNILVSHARGLIVNGPIWGKWVGSSWAMYDVLWLASGERMSLFEDVIEKVEIGDGV